MRERLRAGEQQSGRDGAGRGAGAEPAPLRSPLFRKEHVTRPAALSASPDSGCEARVSRRYGELHKLQRMKAEHTARSVKSHSCSEIRGLSGLTPGPGRWDGQRWAGRDGVAHPGPAGARWGETRARVLHWGAVAMLGPQKQAGV